MDAPGGASGGFLGVSTFFTLSGFLITTLLLREHASSGTIVLRAFWARRFRRLMPAAILTLAGVAAYGRWIATPSQLSRLRWDVISVLAYVSNWRFMVTGNSYFELFSRPSPVQHFWSLSIEEQFYAAFPLVMAGVLARGRSRRAVGLLIAAIALASALDGPVLWTLGSTSARIYYGTDTRIFEILVGALLAIASAPDGLRWPSRRVVAAVGAVALAVVCADFVLVPEDSDMLYQGGLVLHAVASTSAAAAGGPASRAPSGSCTTATAGPTGGRSRSRSSGPTWSWCTAPSGTSSAGSCRSGDTFAGRATRSSTTGSSRSTSRPWTSSRRVAPTSSGSRRRASARPHGGTWVAEELGPFAIASAGFGTPNAVR